MNQVYKTHSKVTKQGFKPSDYITIFADGSFDHKTKAGGWGGWAKFGSPAVTIKASGRAVVKDSFAAETLGLVEMIRRVVESDAVIRNKCVVIQCDCQGALAKLDTSIFTTMGAKSVKLKWVKGHSGIGNNRSAVNHTCDKLARKEMLALRTEIEERQNVK